MRWLTLLWPFMSYLMLGAAGVLGMRHLLAQFMPDAPRWIKAGAPATIGLMLLLDPEAQHFAVSGLSELPFTVLYLGAMLRLARGAGAEYPLAYGLLLGLAGLFRANMLWLAPPCALASAWCAPPGRRVRVGLTVLAGYALPIAPWWIYKWRAVGSPAWGLTRLVVWDQVEGRSWFELYHHPALPPLPHGGEAARLIAAKVWGNLGRMLPALLEGPRGLWWGAIVAWLCTRPRRTLAAAALVIAIGMSLNLLAACASRLSDIPMAITSAAAASVRRGRVQSHATIAPHQSPRGPSRSAGSIRPRFPHTFAAMSRAASPPCGSGGRAGWW